MLEKVTDPYATSRTTRKVGMGLPLLKMNAERTGGNIKILSEEGKGTEVVALFINDDIDRLTADYEMRAEKSGKPWERARSVAKMRGAQSRHRGQAG